MHAEAVVPRRVELTLSRPDNHFRIENHRDGVCIRAARDDLSEKEKLLFVRYLAAEGYIPDLYQWFSGPMAGCYSGLEWIVDTSRNTSTDRARHMALRQIVRVLWCAALLWLALMSFAFVHARCLMPPQHRPASRAEFSLYPRLTIAT